MIVKTLDILSQVLSSEKVVKKYLSGEFKTSEIEDMINSEAVGDCKEKVISDLKINRLRKILEIEEAYPPKNSYEVERIEAE